MLDGSHRASIICGVRYSQLFPKTLRDVPKGVSSDGYRLLYRGGYIRTHGRGLFVFMPLGMRVIHRIRSLISAHMNALGGQEVQAPLVNPFELWQQSGRSDLIDTDLVRFTDRLGRPMVLAPTHEEAMVDLLRTSMTSYRDLPVFLYQFQEKYRDEERTRNGLIRSREFLMKDGYSFHRSFSDLNNFLPKVFRAYRAIFDACNLDTIIAEAGVGYMGGEKSYEFLVPSNAGDDHVIVCDSCGYAANREVAVSNPPPRPSRSSRPREMKKLETPGCTNMARLSKHLDLPKSQLAKTMAFRGGGDNLILAVVRGDTNVSVEKLARLLEVPALRRAKRKEISELGLVPGYLSPLTGLDRLTVVVDHGAADAANLVYGGNQDGVHYADVNFGRDFDADAIGDIAQAEPGATCIHCGGTLEERRATELGNLFRLGDGYSRAMNLWIHDETGRVIYPYMGCYGIGIGRLMQAIAEANHDEKGIVWPVSVAPFHVYLMTIGKSFAVRDAAEGLYKDFGDEVLFDDREESISTKFTDFLLLGIPFRLIVSGATVTEGTVELFDRRTGEREKVSIGSARSEVESRLEALTSWRSS